jgi:hypothetical protein
MIKVGNILIDYDSIDTVLPTFTTSEKRGIDNIQIIYKSGVIKNVKSYEIGMSCNDFMNALEKEHSKEANKYLFKMLAMFQNGNTPS